MSNNHESEEVRRKCPLLGAWCIGGACALSIELMKAGGVMQQKVQACSIPAIVLILSEINLKTLLPQQKVNLNLPNFKSLGG